MCRNSVLNSLASRNLHSSFISNLLLTSTSYILDGSPYYWRQLAKQQTITNQMALLKIIVEVSIWETQYTYTEPYQHFLFLTSPLLPQARKVSRSVARSRWPASVLPPPRRSRYNWAPSLCTHHSPRLPSPLSMSSRCFMTRSVLHYVLLDMTTTIDSIKHRCRKSVDVMHRIWP